MCGRFVLMALGKTLAEIFEVKEAIDEQPRYNVAPTQNVRIVRLNHQTAHREMSMVKWGLIPSWAKDPSIGTRLINARSETVHQKPAFRASFKSRRCLVPSDGFYEWEKKAKVKQPYLFRMVDDRPFAFAGLWDRWQAPDGKVTESCTIITTPANERLISIHDRMPAILKPEDYGIWLDPAVKNPNALLELMIPFPSELMTGIPVSTKVNRASYDGPDCIEPIVIGESLF
ncbi:MAG: SOS response-associated peptidase [Desulfomonile tiedjei]|uniref:Abasic site processing protein n=1 Tax=Desulfomonile tiedjei TaxID=2358 RepID=A0A9D6V586_9BACT|nr:SOS response-associated peptidase [Desulfomonile tiedjei]